MAATSATNASLALSGLASGIDWTSIVNELVTVERAPETQMTAQQTTYQQRNTSYQGIGSRLTTLAADVTSLSDPSFFDNRTTSVSNTAVASADAAAGTPLGNYAFKVTQMASDAVQQGASGITKSLNATNDVSALTLSSAGFATPITAGTFTVNGQTVTIAASDTLQSVFDKINTATGGPLGAGAVTGSYNHLTDEISLNSSSPIVLGSSTDTSNFLQVAQLYNNGTGAISSTSALGGINLASNLASANFATPVTDGGAGAGQFLINGVAIGFNMATDGVKDVLNRINNSAAGVTATYDSVNAKFELTSKTTGDVGITLKDLTGNFLAATGLTTGTLQRGANMQYTVNGGGTLTSQSNTIDGSASGITGLSVTALGTGTTTISVGSDTSKISTAISSFVTDYNAVQSYISSQTKPTTDSSGNTVAGPLTGDLDVTSIEEHLRQGSSAFPSGLTGTIKSLTDLGILSNGTDNTLALSSTVTLNNTLSSNLEAVKQLFSNSTNGVATQLNTYINDVNGTNGALANDEANMTKQSTDITASIASLEQRIGQDQTRMTNEFVAMEQAINGINAQKQYLNSYFNTTGSSQAAPTKATG